MPPRYDTTDASFASVPFSGCYHSMVTDSFSVRQDFCIPLMSIIMGPDLCITSATIFKSDCSAFLIKARFINLFIVWANYGLSVLDSDDETTPHKQITAPLHGFPWERTTVVSCNRFWLADRARNLSYYRCSTLYFLSTINLLIQSMDY